MMLMPSSEKSSFREQFRLDMESAVHRAAESERLLNSSLAMWERNFNNDLTATTRKLEVLRALL
jgi:hypothetical protein